MDGYFDEGKYDPLSLVHFGSNAYLENIESRYQGYIHELFQNAYSVYRLMEIFQDLADLVNSKSETPGEYRPAILVSRK